MTLPPDFQPESILCVFTDIDGTLTENGRLPASSYQMMWELSQKGIHVIPVTGRPAGWCDMIARFWPVHGVIGENGALAYRLTPKRMLRKNFLEKHERQSNRQRLKNIGREVLKRFPQSKIASDQFARQVDIAIDFAEDVHPPLPLSTANRIAQMFEKEGAHAKVSNIHVNAWFGDHDKLSSCKWYCREWLGFELEKSLDRVVFFGDSPNDEPMFAYFKWSVAVANIKPFWPQLKHKPLMVTDAPEAAGFVEGARRLFRVTARY